ncbi:MarR family winged helix-turn-helix transcriptional regulator [Pseudactinotalea suaedae]|uniref:MarR family winged helix-turn-helix transcriptional regulator n=1 Tax=Pseudactinotalea suaedae TaxID=1524924 RepID=UPI001F4FEF50|nr:MarR family transcriptional regulator [Pseudactinotalea suaedae]
MSTPTQPDHGVGVGPEAWPTGRLLSAAARRMENEWNAYLARWHLNHASLPALAILLARPLSQRDLAAALGVTEQTTSRIVAGLERNGYVTRQRLPDDRRVRLLAATGEGAAVMHQLTAAGSVDSIVEHGLSAEEEATLRRLLMRFL